MNKFRILFLILAFVMSLESTLLGQANDSTWAIEAEKVAWEPRDSQGEVVFKNKLWIMGGWFDSYEAPPRDVWSSKNGKDWKLINSKAPWRHSDLPMTTVFKKRIWMMGGWFNGRLPGHSASNEVWSSRNGKKWKLVNRNANWSPRLGAAIVTFKGKMWLMGGIENYYFGDDKSLKNDVWSSTDGKIWKLESEQAAWSPRAYHQALVLNGRIYVMGGGNYVPHYFALNDVWSSDDGIHWIKETANAPWHERIWFSSVVYRDHLWIMAGWSNDPFKNWADIWYSKDGREWTEYKSRYAWSARHEASALVFKDKIWIMGGNTPPLVNDVWSLYLPKNWGK